MKLKLFISSSWINRHAVELLSLLLESDEGYAITSFVADNDHEFSMIGQNKDIWNQDRDYGEWVCSEEGHQVFDKDLTNIRASDVLIIIEPAGRDAWAHAGLAFAWGKKVFALNSRGRKVGLMRRLATWAKDVDELRRLLEIHAESSHLKT